MGNSKVSRMNRSAVVAENTIWWKVAVVAVVAVVAAVVTKTTVQRISGRAVTSVVEYY